MQEYGYLLLKANLAFIEAERLANARQNKTDPVKLRLNGRNLIYYKDLPLPFYPKSALESLRIYDIAHLLIGEYYLEGFNPKDGEVILDCGGASGDTALFFSAFYPKSPIHVFECDPDSYKLLRKNIEANGLDSRVYAHNYGVADANKELYFENWQLVDTPSPTSLRVKCLSLDSFIKDRGIENLGLIKMDIEGGEQLALQGARESILRFKPKLMIPIYHLENDIVEIPNFLHSLGIDLEFRLKWVEMRCYGVDCFLLVRFKQ